jgi:hypothetical protein
MAMNDLIDAFAFGNVVYDIPEREGNDKGLCVLVVGEHHADGACAIGMMLSNCGLCQNKKPV